MKNLAKSITVEVMGGYEDFKTIYTEAEMRKMKCRYIGSDMDSDISVYEVKSTGEMVAVQ